MPNRKRVPSDVETRVLSRSARRCCLCFHLKQDFTEKLGQLAHLDHDPSNAADDNLAFLCMDHHSLYDSRTSQHKNHTIGEVKRARAKLYSEIDRRKPCEWLLVLDGTFSEFDKARVEAIVEHLRKVLGDPHLTIKRTDRGSVNLVIESSEESFEAMKRRVESGELKEVLGHPVRKIRRLDEAGFQEFWKEHWETVVRYLKRRLSDPADAEDAAMMAFQKAWETRNFSIARLLQAATFAATPMYRRRIAELPALESAHEEPEAMFLHAERLKIVRDAIASLAPRERAVIVLYMQDFTTKEIAEALSVPQGTVNTVLFRARKKLRSMIQNRMPNE